MHYLITSPFKSAPWGTGAETQKDQTQRHLPLRRILVDGWHLGFQMSLRNTSTGTVAFCCLSSLSLLSVKMREPSQESRVIALYLTAREKAAITSPLAGRWALNRFLLLKAI